MRITKNQLRQIIKEELGRVLGEGRPSRPSKERATRREPDPRYPGEIVPFIQHAQGATYRDEHQEDLHDQLLQLKTQDLGSGLTSFGRDQMQAIESELETRKGEEMEMSLGTSETDPDYRLGTSETDPDYRLQTSPMDESRRRKVRKTRKR
jgi:hypothetical protein